MNSFTRKKSKLRHIVAILIGVVLLMGSTYAWRDLSQHKTNPWGDFRDLDSRNVTLNDEFTPPNGIVAGQDVSKKVSVSNLADSGGTVCVRLAVREFMQLRIKDSKKYYMTKNHANEDVQTLFATFVNDDYAIYGYPKGSYIPYEFLTSNPTLKEIAFRYGSQEVVTGFDPTEPDGSRYTKTNYATTTTKELRNGIYGKPMKVPGEILQFWGKSPFAQPNNLARDQVGTDNKIVPNGECKYEPFIFGGQGLEPLFTGGSYPVTTENQMRDFVSLTGAEVVLLADWVGKAPTERKNKWVMGDNGYVYWSTPLEPGEETDKLLTAAKFIKDPKATANTNTNNNPGSLQTTVDYIMHIDMDATDATEQEIIGVFTGVSGVTWGNLNTLVTAGAITANQVKLLKELGGVAW